MAVKIGIIGMPNVGKSTLFNAITNSEVEAANYPFATIEPNVGTVEIKDKRVDLIAEIFDSKKLIFNTIEFVDIAGLVKGASKGEGLGNKFLSNIRSVDAIVNVVRLFENPDIVHVENTINPLRDLEIIQTELILSDIEQCENYIQKSGRKIEASNIADDIFILKTVKKVYESLRREITAQKIGLSKEEIFSIKSFSFLSLKPIIYIANVTETELEDPSTNPHYKEFSEYMSNIGSRHIVLSAQIEYEIAKLEIEEQTLFLLDLGLSESGLNILSAEAFKTLGLRTYFTAGPQEAHAWAYVKGMTAPEAAGIIHTDFQKGFIKAEVYKITDLEKHRSETELKNKGLIKLEGKEYLVKDGDVCHFRFNN